jgi:outer membrane protease
VYAGLALDTGPRDPFGTNGWLASASVRFGLPLKTGIIEDRDWQYEDNDGLTNYSRHDAFSQNAILADVSAGYTWRIMEFLVAGAFAEFSYMYFSWTAEDGYYQYLNTDLAGNLIPGQTWTDDIAKKNIYGIGIQYTQNWFIFSPGIFVKGKISRLFSAEGNYKLTPLIYCADRDYHFYPYSDRYGGLFTGFFSFGHFIESGGKIIFSPEKNFDLALNVSYRYISMRRGNTYYSSNTSNVSQNHDGTAGYSALNFGLSAKIRVAGRD